MTLPKDKQMTDIEQKALALVNEVFAEMGGSPIDYAALIGANDVVTLALCRAIEQHEAFRREVSDAMKEYCKGHGIPNYGRFIITKPNPLVEVMNDFMSMKGGRLEECVKQFRDALEARGLEIREKNDG